MMNSMNMNIELTRIEVCDLLLACLSVEHEANDGGKKWKKLHEKLKEQLADFDKQFEE